MNICYIEGKSFPYKDSIKEIKSSVGKRVFAWEDASKSWVARDVPDHGIDKLKEIVERKCPGCTLRVAVGQRVEDIDEADIPF
jgi:hypothetical protein